MTARFTLRNKCTLKWTWEDPKDGVLPFSQEWPKGKRPLEIINDMILLHVAEVGYAEAQKNVQLAFVNLYEKGKLWAESTHKKEVRVFIEEAKSEGRNI